MIREEDLLDLTIVDPSRAAEAAVHYRDTAARLVEHAREAESAQSRFAESFRSRRLPDTVARLVTPDRAALEAVHATTQDLCQVTEAAYHAHRDLVRRRDELLDAVQRMYAWELPPLLEEWMAANGGMRYPEVDEVPAALAREENARREVAAFNRAAEEFAAEFERAIRALHATARDRSERLRVVTASTSTVSAATAPSSTLPAAKLTAMTPAQVVAWWAALTPAERRTYLKKLPGVIGGLDGVDAASRSAANRAELERLRAKLKKIGKADPGYEAAQVKLRAIEAIRKKLGNNPEKLKPPLQLLLLDLSGVNPKAAIAVGDLDTADHVTYNVPGMGTTVAKDIGGWTNASKNLYYQQQDLAQIRGGSARIAVVAWIGYDVPQDFLEVNNSSAARSGGKALAGALEGTLAAREWPSRSEHLSVVGFSYGSAVAGQALKQASAGAFVSVGSAGIPTEVAGRVPYRAPLNVPDGGIASGQASSDTVATLGRFSSGRADPSEHGAVPFSTDDARTPEGETTAGTTDHVATVHASDATKYGYYDQGTTSLYNMAAHTTGHPEAVAK
ncbi:alpha/beta hydrolase [Leifsonia sp. NPDC056824]|uniref:alpha/beta hydrolase n=1 Tax=Leifsonia sp. NPDC056824 TaxID=3345953 RepID=UPI003691116D